MARAGSEGRSFEAGFPETLLRALLGSSPPAVGLLGVLVVVAGLFVSARRDGTMPAATVAVLVAVVWLILAPVDLYPRFFVWLVPGVAVSVAAAVSRRTVLVVPAVLAMVVMASDQLPHWRADDRALPEAAMVVDVARRDGRTPCASGGEALLAYTSQPREVAPTDTTGCDLLVVIGTSVDPQRFAGDFPTSQGLGRGGAHVLRR